MKQEKINEIIRYVFNNNMPNNIKSIFQRWLISPHDKEIKEGVLNELWDTLPAISNIKECEKGLKKLHAQIAIKSNKVILWQACRKIAAVITIGLTIFGSGYFTSRILNKDNQKFYLLTAEKSKGKFILPDNTVVWLNSNSRLTYDDNFAKESRDVKLEGEAFFEVTKDSKAFNVQMDKVSVEVLGTKFDARSYKRYANEEIILVEGVVKISGRGINDVILKPNERFTFNRENSHANVEEIKSINYSTWFNEYLVFEDDTLEDIFSQLGRWYNIDIVVDPEVNINTRMSFKLYSESVEDILSVISKISGLKYNISANKIVLTN